MGGSHREKDSFCSARRLSCHADRRLRPVDRHVRTSKKETIVVTGTRTQEVGGVQAPDTTKAKAVLTQEIIARQNPGQTILDTINLVPGVSFQNNDAYGSSGGTLNIRGFDSTASA